MYKIERNSLIVREVVVHMTGNWQRELEVRELSFPTMKKAEEVAKAIGGIAFEVVKEQEQEQEQELIAA